MRKLQFNEKHNVINCRYEPSVGHSMEATVLHDGQKRFKTGDPIITSPVVAIMGNADKQGYLTAKTRNTTYVVIPDNIYKEGTLEVSILEDGDYAIGSRAKKREDYLLA